ncbi:MAG: NADH:flavin oxidoreductase/NADH oxidase [Dehalococcoidia bacterium]
MLFTPLTLRGVQLRNRIAVSPMSQYAAVDGRVGDWHLVSLGARAAGGAGLVMVEATAVSPEARGTIGDVGLWDDTHIAPLAHVASFIRSMGAVAGIQLQHAGPKACTMLPWEGGRHLAADDPAAWPIYGPTDAPFGGHLLRAPVAMSRADLRKVAADFAGAARRAVEAGFQLVQIHAAHGYLVQSFLSPFSNRRSDEYGGTPDSRSRLLREIVAAIREVLPDGTPLSVRLGAADFNAEGVQLDESIELARRLSVEGVDLLDVSVSFSGPVAANLPWDEPAFLTPTAGIIREAAGIMTASSWAIDTPEMAERALGEGRIDLVMLGRASLMDPNWPIKAAVALGEPDPASRLPVQHGFWLKRWLKGGRALR